MYTVIFQSPQTAQLSRDYRRLLFDRYIEEGWLDFCTWIKSGDSVDSAVPSLYDLIAGKREWRAIIVQTEQDRAAAPETPENNPFDYLDNRERSPYDVWESEIPLIRLTQLLAGVPEPELKFEPVIKEEDGMVDRLVYHPHRNEEAMAEHRRLSEKYLFCENRPKELLVISTRQPVDNTANEIDAAWSLRLETESSEFWHRNRYPSSCRFLVFDVLNERHSLYSGSIFKLWTTVLMLSMNQIDSSTLQAYRLYRASIQFDTPMLSRALSSYAAKLEAMRVMLEDAENNKQTLEAQIASTAPVLDTEINVSFSAKNLSNLTIQTNPLGLTRDCPMEEADYWNGSYRNASVAVQELLRSPAKMLDVAAEDTRSRGVYPKDKVEILNRYQRVDLQEAMDAAYFRALDARRHLGVEYKKRQEERKIIDSQVRARIGQRLTRKNALIGTLIAMLAVLLGFLPYLITAAMKSGKALLWACLPLLGVLLVCSLFGLAELWIQRKEMKDAMADHNRCTKEIFHEVQSSAQHYTAYLSALCTYLRGQSYLHREEELLRGSANAASMRRGHQRALTQCNALLRVWSMALGATIDSSYASGRIVSFDPSIPPEENRAYRIETAVKETYVPLNRTGEQLVAPFEFIRSMNLEREELYDNADADK